MGVIEDLQSLFENVSKLRSNPEKLRTAIAGAFLVVGFVAVKMPLAARYESKQADLREAQLVASNTEKVQRLEAGVKLFSHRLEYSLSAAEWQAYYYQVAGATGVGITRFEDTQTNDVHDFKIAKMQIAAIGSYAEIVAFIDALERGSRLVRLEDIKVSVSEGVLTLRCRLLGITRESPESSEGSPEGIFEEEDVA